MLPAAVQATDTVVMVAARDGLATAALVTDLVLTGVVALLLAGLVLVFFQLRGIQRSVSATLGRLERRADPVIDRAREVAANVEFISAAVRTDVQRVSAAVHSLSDRLQGASDRMEQRVQEFNALMEVVQSEAEDIFIGSASAVRGVRAGAHALRHGDDDGLLDDDDEELADEAGLPPRALGPAAVETDLAPEAAPGGVQVTGPAQSAARVGGAGARRAGA
jgi:hypothetical protein